ncbi:MAG: histidine kinase, partial [Chitinophagaceae bacterium]
AIKTIVWIKGKLLIASAAGVYFLDENGHDSPITTLIWAKRSTSAFPHDSGFYIGTLNGLFDLRKNQEAVFLGEKNSLFRNRISAITKTDDGIFWIATYGGGIVGFKDDKVITHLSQENGLSSNICRNIFVADNNLWVGTDKGLNKITRYGNNYRVTKFTTADGLNADIINAVLVDNGVVYVGTPGGVTYFNENKISQNSNCDLRITGINSSDRVWNFDTTNFLLRHRDNNIRVEFVGLSYKSAGDIVYKYRLVGLDSSWKTTNETFLSYPALPSGKYKLQLMAINKYGIQSKIKEVDFTIEELLEEKTWFRLLLVVVGVACFWLIVVLYIKGIRRKEALKASTVRKMTELEQKALRAQMNPHFIFNSLNSIQQYVMDKDTIGANKFITAFSSLIRQTLDFSSKQEITLEEELQYLSTYLELEKTRMEDKFIYEIEVAPQVPVSEFYIPPMILQPYVENSIRHGVGYRRDKAGKIMINIKRKADKVVCIVEDNGVGRLVAGQFKMSKPLDRQSKGMSLTADRVEMFNKNNRNKIELNVYDMIDEQNNPLGTRVVISFPF